MQKRYSKKISNYILFLFFTVAFIEIVAEMYYDSFVIWITKPLIIPLLFLYYFLKSNIKNYNFILALFFSLLASVFFIERTPGFIITGSVFALIYRIVIVFLVLKLIKMPPLKLMLIGCIPFLLIYLSVILLRYETLDNNGFFFIINAIFVIFLGGFSISNYFVNETKTNYYLFLSVVFFALTHFIYLLKIFSDENSLLYAFSMLFYVFGQFLITKFILLTERKYRNYKIVNLT